MWRFFQHLARIFELSKKIPPWNVCFAEAQCIVHCSHFVMPCICAFVHLCIYVFVYLCIYVFLYLCICIWVSALLWVIQYRCALFLFCYALFPIVWAMFYIFVSKLFLLYIVATELRRGVDVEYNHNQVLNWIWVSMNIIILVVHQEFDIKKDGVLFFSLAFTQCTPSPPPSPRTQLILCLWFSKRTVTESHRALHCLPTESHKIFTALVTVLATTVATILVTNVVTILVTTVVKLSPTLGARIVVTQKSRNRPVFRSLHSVTVSFPEKSFFLGFQPYLHVFSSLRILPLLRLPFCGRQRSGVRSRGSPPYM